METEMIQAQLVWLESSAMECLCKKKINVTVVT